MGGPNPVHWDSLRWRLPPIVNCSQDRGYGHHCHIWELVVAPEWAGVRKEVTVVVRAKRRQVWWAAEAPIRDGRVVLGELAKDPRNIRGLIEKVRIALDRALFTLGSAVGTELPALAELLHLDGSSRLAIVSEAFEQFRRGERRIESDCRTANYGQTEVDASLRYMLGELAAARNQFLDVVGVVNYLIDGYNKSTIDPIEPLSTITRRLDELVNYRVGHMRTEAARIEAWAQPLLSRWLSPTERVQAAFAAVSPNDRVREAFADVAVDKRIRGMLSAIEPKHEPPVGWDRPVITGVGFENDRNINSVDEVADAVRETIGGAEQSACEKSKMWTVVQEPLGSTASYAMHSRREVHVASIYSVGEIRQTHDFLHETLGHARQHPPAQYSLAAMDRELYARTTTNHRIELEAGAELAAQRALERVGKATGVDFVGPTSGYGHFAGVVDRFERGELSEDAAKVELRRMFRTSVMSTSNREYEEFHLDYFRREWDEFRRPTSSPSGPVVAPSS